MSIGRVLIFLVAVALVAALVIAFMPQPVRVDVAEIVRGPLVVTVDDDGRTRIREKYVVSAPLAGQIQRIRLRAGDEVRGGVTLLTTLAPADPALLDARAVAENEARVRRAEAAVGQAGPIREQARVQYDFAENEVARVRSAFDRGAATAHELESAIVQQRTAMEAFNAAHFAMEIARFELELARAALLRTSPEATAAQRVEHLEIMAPIDGRVLQVFQESMAVVMPGTPLVEIGDPTDLEVEIDVLSSDAVRIAPGARVSIEHWGGSHALDGRVRLVEPRGFTHISALGVEEQRVNVIVDFTASAEDRAQLGDGYRVEARIVVWEADNVLLVPTSALFRAKGIWSVFIVDEGRARLREVQIGRRTGMQAQVVGGLTEGDRVILHPSDAVRDGGRVQIR